MVWHFVSLNVAKVLTRKKSVIPVIQVTFLAFVAKIIVIYVCSQYIKTYPIYLPYIVYMYILFTYIIIYKKYDTVTQYEIKPILVAFRCV